MHVRRRRDHPRNPAITARNIATGVSRRIRTLPPDGRTTSIAAEPGSVVDGGRGDNAGTSPVDDVNRTGTKSAASPSRSRPSSARRRQLCNRLGQTSYRAATSQTRVPGSRLSATIRNFSAMPQRRRRSRPVMISIVRLATVLNSDLKALLKVYSLGIGTGRNKAGLTGRLPSSLILSCFSDSLVRPEGRDHLVGASPTRAMVGWPGSWRAARMGNHPGRSPATKAASGGRANRRAVTCVKPEQASKRKSRTPTRPEIGEGSTTRGSR